jgi:hypothetical protein
LDNVQGLQPEPGAASQKNETRAISRGQFWPFDLTPEDDELVAQYRVLGDQVSPAPLCVCEDTGDKCGRHGFRPLLDVQAKADSRPCAEKRDDLNHSVVDSNWVCESTSKLAGLLLLAMQSPRIRTDESSSQHRRS